MKIYFKTLFIFLCFSLEAFDMIPVTPQPVLGYKEHIFRDNNLNMNRSLLIWYPVDPLTKGKPSENKWDVFLIAEEAEVASFIKKAPVIILSHGYTGNPHQLSWLIKSLVRDGFIVIAVQHQDLLQGKIHINHWIRARDISLIIDTFVTNPIAKSANLNKIGIAGYSLGGTTSIWTAGGRATKLLSLIPDAEYASPEDYIHADEALPTLNKTMMSKDWRDARVQAAFVMAPAWAWLFDESSLKQISIPTYLIATEGDRVLVSAKNAGYFAKHIPHSIFQIISGRAGHYVFISALNEAQRKAVSPTPQLNFLFEDDVSVDRAWIQFQVGQEAIRFFRQKL